jgi:alpha-glucosidase
MLPAKTLANSPSDWWRHAVIYQIYPRSFADGNGDGVGDLAGIIGRLPAIADLGVDAIWLSPFYRSPQKDAGYDVSDYCDIDPVFGTLAEAEKLIATAHDLGLRIIVDVVPNHSSDQHAWFQAALAAAPGSPERERYMFRDGLGDNGEVPPNNWESVFGGPAWSRITNPDGSPGQWYLHIFDQSQPDFNWENPEVWNLFDGVLRFWLDRGVDGFRVDVAHGLIKEAGLPDRDLSNGPPKAGDRSPFWDQDDVHEVYRAWRKILDGYGDDRMMCAEAWVMPLSKMAHYVRPDEMHQAFNFGYLASSWEPMALRAVIDESLGAFGGVGAPSTWVLSNHDVIRHRSRLATNFTEEGQPTGIGPKSEHKPDEELGHRRGRAATALMLGLPGSAYLFQGEELGLPEAIDIPDDRRDDPTFFRTNGERYGRDGCRVPIPWEAGKPAYGFNDSGASWLPQPAVFGELARDQQQGVESSTLELYLRLLRLRSSHGLGSGDFSWLPDFASSTVAFNNSGVAVIGNLGTTPIALPPGEVLASSGPLVDGQLPGDATAWVKLTN